MIIDVIGDLILNSLKMLLYLVGSIVAAGLVLEVLKRITSRYMFWSLGYFGIYSTAWLGTPVHEAGHALMCLLFGHKLKEVKLLKFNEEGALGHVSHSYNPKSLYHKIGNFFIGIAPILSGTAIILILIKILLPQELGVMGDFFKVAFNKMIINPSFDILKDLLTNIFYTMFSHENIVSVKFWILMYLLISISSHMALSPSDMKGALSGLISMYGIIFLLNMIIYLPFVDFNKISNMLLIYNSYLIFALLISVFCSACAAILSLILYGIKSALGG